MMRRLPPVILSCILVSSFGCADETSPRDPDTAVSDTSSPEDTSGAEPADVAASDELGGAEDATTEVTDLGVADPSDPLASLCRETGGTWAEGACTCAAANPGLPEGFDPVHGCRPDPAALCGATGGVWEGDACACAQDGVSLHFEFDPALGCRFPDVAPLEEALRKTRLMEAVADHLAPGQPVYVIDRPGVFDMVTRVDAPEDVLARLAPFEPLSEAAGTCDGPLITDAWPEVDCEGSGLSLEGCFFRQVSDEYHRASELMALAVTYEFGDWTPAEIDAVYAAESMILAIFLDSDHGVTLAFRRYEGRWVLVVIDLSRYSCSA
jgi:hypothetical protein